MSAVLAEAEVETEAGTEAVDHFKFDAEFQDKIAALAMRDENFARRTDGLIQPRSFEDEANAKLVEIAQSYYKTYRTVPASIPVWKVVFKEAIDRKVIRKDFAVDVMAKFKALHGHALDDREFAIDKVAEFARHQAIQRAMIESFDLLESHKMPEIEKIWTSALGVGAAKDIPMIDYWEKVDERTAVRDKYASGEEAPRGISTGIIDLDRLLYHRGWGRKELSVIMGGAKKGKSMALGDFGVRASLLGYNVLYVTLEVSEDIIAERMDANVSGCSMDDLVLMRESVMSTVKTKGASKRGRMMISTAPAGSFSPADLSRLIESYRAKGITFDLICPDYLDIMAPTRWTPDAIENSKQIWTECREIAKKENAAILTATQTNREGYKSSTAKAGDVAEDFNKIRIADLVMSINRSDEERASGEARLFFAATRNGKGEFTVRIKQELEKMKFIKSVEDIYEGDSDGR